ncbi:MAG TPA: response regulator, partial [Opitutaceae bacterium]|nr:response regulator [Opitutaceae bacterium]
ASGRPLPATPGGVVGCAYPGLPDGTHSHPSLGSAGNQPLMNERATVLVIDDVPANIGLVLDALADRGYRVLVAESGHGALEQLRHGKPDLILLDVIMPGMDGFETCAAIKKDPAWRDVPILFMTSLDDVEQKVRAFESGAVDYIVKPIYVAEVIARVRAHLELRRLRQALEEELAMRLEAENQLAQSLDRAIVLVAADRQLLFSTRTARTLLHRHHPGWDGTKLPECHGTLIEKRLSAFGVEPEVFLLQEDVPSPGPEALGSLGLTARESEVLFWIAQGKSNPDIALILGTSPRTIHKHVENLFRKLGCETRAAAALRALEYLRPVA